MGNSITRFFSTSNPQELFDTLAVFGSKKTQDIVIDPSSFKMNFKFSEKNKIDPKQLEIISFSVNIMQVGDRGDKYCVEFTRKRGDVLAFNEIFKNARDFFAGHVNTT